MTLSEYQYSDILFWSAPGLSGSGFFTPKGRFTRYIFGGVDKRPRGGFADGNRGAPVSVSAWVLPACFGPGNLTVNRNRTNPAPSICPAADDSLFNAYRNQKTVIRKTPGETSLFIFRQVRIGVN